jgi:hypothetical protein
LNKPTLISLLKTPESVTEKHFEDLREMSVLYPYFAAPHVLLAKLLNIRQDINAKHYAKIASLYVADGRWFYYFLYPDEIPLSARQGERKPRFSGDYFGMLEMLESQGGDTKESLRTLAERLKAARNLVTAEKPKERTKAVEPQKTAIISSSDYFAENIVADKNEEISEELVKKQIKEKKYSSAIETLHKLNLVFPKKSIYFAAQIQFLEKVIENSHKKN